ncbi:MAG: hypothetical protein WB609_10265 [Candidatus Cybelea sp.]
MTLASASYEDGTLLVDVDGYDQRVQYRTASMLPLTQLAAAPQIMELFEFMLTWYAADRLTPRTKHSWARKFVIEFPVWRLCEWNAIKRDLEEIIRRSTGDYVTIVPFKRPRRWYHRDSELRFSLESPLPVSVVLLSDGLDSLCGAYGALKNPVERPAFVSISTNTRKGARLNRLAGGLQSAYGDRPIFHRIEMNLVKAPRKAERTQRSRTMLAIAAGLTVAAAYGSPVMRISENGMGILNLPIPWLQGPHESSQVLHPVNLQLWEHVSNTLVNGAIIEYPNRFKTKAQMLRELPPEAHALIGYTSSCDSPQRRDRYPDCGVCGSCTVRRLSLKVASLAEFDVRYTSVPPRKRTYDARRLLEDQRERLSEALLQRDPWLALVKAQPTLANIVVDGSAGAHQTILSTIELLKEHVKELRFSEQIAHAI